MIQSEFPVAASAEVVIVGAGPAGCAAALAAARNGARVVVLEQTGAPGGMATSGLVPMFSPVADRCRQFYGGIFAALNAELCRRMNRPVEPEAWQPIDAEKLKRILDEWLAAAGAEIIYCAKTCHVFRQDRRITGVLAAFSNGLGVVRGQTFIDATGDGLLAMLSGAEFECGDPDGNTMSPTLCAQFAGIDFERYYPSWKAGHDDRYFWRLLQQTGKAPLEEHHLVCMKQITATTATSNIGHIYGGNTMEPRQLSDCYREGRRIAAIFERFYREHVPGFERAVLVNTASLLGVRESRRICGDYRLRFDDYQARREFSDGIGRCNYPVDIHACTLDANSQRQVEARMEETRLKPGESYAIPLRAMLPCGLDNLIVAGRSVSADRPMQSSLRVMPPCFVMGEAAGVAAQLAGMQPVRSVDTALLRQRLLAGGAIL